MKNATHVYELGADNAGLVVVLKQLSEAEIAGYVTARMDGWTIDALQAQHDLRVAHPELAPAFDAVQDDYLPLYAPLPVRGQCETCTNVIVPSSGRGRPRIYCETCRP